VATVTCDGEVKALTPGYAVITATTSNGLTAQVTVNVAEPRTAAGAGCGGGGVTPPSGQIGNVSLELNGDEVPTEATCLEIGAASQTLVATVATPTADGTTVAFSVVPPTAADYFTSSDDENGTFTFTLNDTGSVAPDGTSFTIIATASATDVAGTKSASASFVVSDDCSGGTPPGVGHVATLALKDPADDVAKSSIDIRICPANVGDEQSGLLVPVTTTSAVGVVPNIVYSVAPGSEGLIDVNQTTGTFSFIGATPTDDANPIGTIIATATNSEDPLDPLTATADIYISDICVIYAKGVFFTDSEGDPTSSVAICLAKDSGTGLVSLPNVIVTPFGTTNKSVTYSITAGDNDDGFENPIIELDTDTGEYNLTAEGALVSGDHVFTVTATAEGEDSLDPATTATATITVTDTCVPTIPVTSITLNDLDPEDGTPVTINIPINVDFTYPRRVYASVIPTNATEQGITFESSDPTLLDVDSQTGEFELTALGKTQTDGTTVEITATADGDSNIYAVATITIVNDPTATAALTTAREDMLGLVNELRDDEGRAPFDMGSAALCEAAQIRAYEIEYVFNLTHDRPDGSACSTVLGDVGITSQLSYAENIAYGSATLIGTVQQAFEAWENSPGHLDNMLSTTNTQMCLGHTVVGDMHYWVKEFLKPTP
jgi:uncharacterized protein YkwD